MTWTIEVSDEFAEWYEKLSEEESVSVDRSVDLLAAAGPVLGRPHADTIQGSNIPNLKELRVQHGGRPIRILFAFDPRRVGYLILAGDKTGNSNWYTEFVPRAESIYKQHLAELGEGSHGSKKLEGSSS